MKIGEFRSKLAAENDGVDPYADLTDVELASRIHQKHYADIPRRDFYSKVGLEDLSTPESGHGAPGKPASPISRRAPERDLTMDGSERPSMASALRPRMDDPRLAGPVQQALDPATVEARDQQELTAARRIPGEVADLAGGMYREGAANVGRFLAEQDSRYAAAAAEARRGAGGDDPINQRGFERGAEQATDLAFQADMRAGRGAREARYARTDMEGAIHPDAGAGERAIVQGVGSFLYTAPVVTLGALVPGGQPAALSALGGSTGLNRYYELIDQGVPQDAAALSGVLLGGLEGLTEAFPLGTLAKQSPFIKQASEFVVQDVLGENVMAVAQLADDFHLGLRDDVTIQDIQHAIKETTGATIVGAGAQLTVSQITQAIIEEANQRAQARVPTLTEQDVYVPPPPVLGEDDVVADQATGQAEDITLEGDGELLPGEMGVEETQGEDITLDASGQAELKGIDRAEPPVPPGMVRMYHGGNNQDADDMPRWFSTSREYAEGYAGKSGGTVSYVDVPADSEYVTDPDYPDQNATAGFTFNRELPAELANQRKPLAAAPAAPRAAARKRLNLASGFKRPAQGQIEVQEAEHIDYEGVPEPSFDEPLPKTPAERRANMEAKRQSIREAFTGEGADAGVTYIQGDHGWHGVAVRGIARAWVRNEQTARELVEEMSQEIASGNIDQAAAQRAELAEYGERPKTFSQRVHEAASSPKNDRPEPTQKQLDAGNYKKGHVRVHGMDVSIENPIGSIRRSKPDAPVQWERKITKGHYGYIRGTEDNTGEHVDVFVGPNKKSPRVYVIDQVIDGKFDEPKVMMGYLSEEAATKAYLANYQKGWKGLGAMTEMNIYDFKKWVTSRKAKEPVSWVSPRDPRLDQRVDRLKHMASRAGWQEVGGRVITDNDPIKPTVKGRTNWLPHEEWFRTVQQEAPLPNNKEGKATERAVNKAFAGEKLTAAEDRHIKAMLDVIDAEDRELAELAGQFTEDPEQLSDTELNALEAKLERLAKQQADEAEDEADIPFPTSRSAVTSDEPMFERAALLDPVKALRVRIDAIDQEINALLDNRNAPNRWERMSALEADKGKLVEQAARLSRMKHEDAKRKFQEFLEERKKAREATRDEPMFERGQRQFTRDELDKVADKIAEKHGLAGLELYPRSAGVELAHIEVAKAEQGSGKGSAAMREIISWADQNGVRLMLTPGLRDASFGTTSRTRLVKFYKRFGFVENKGRKKDFTFTDGMYRDPRESTPMFERKDAKTFDLFNPPSAPAEPPRKVKDDSSRPKGPIVQTDLFGGATDAQQALERVRAEKDRRRSSGQESVETGRPDDLFSQSRKQVDVEDRADDKPRKNVDIKTHIREHILHDLQPGNYGGKRTAQAIADNTGDPRREQGYTVPLKEVQPVLDELEREGVIVKNGPSYMLAPVSDKPVKRSGERTGGGFPMFDEHSGIKVGDRVKVGNETGTVASIFEVTDAKMRKKMRPGKDTWVRAQVNWDKDKTAQHVDIDDLKLVEGPKVEQVKEGEKGQERYRTDKRIKKYLMAKRPHEPERIINYRTESVLAVRQAMEDSADQDVIDFLKGEYEWALERLEEHFPDTDWRHTLKRKDGKPPEGGPGPVEDEGDSEAEATDETNVEQGAAPSYADQVMTLESSIAFHERLRNGEVSLDEYKGTFEAIKKSGNAIVVELEGKTKDQLLEIHRDYYRKNEKKDWHVRNAYEDLLSRFAIGKGVSFVVGGSNYRQSYENAITKIVENATEADLAAYAEKIKKMREEHEASLAGIENPQTLDDFKSFIRYKGESKLTDEQMERFDALHAEDSRQKLKEAKERRERERSQVKSAGRTVGAKVIDSKHTKKGYDIFVVQMEERVERSVYDTLNASAKKLGGYYSSYRGGGAIPGFTFTERDKAEAFAKLLQTGDTAAATEVAQQRREDFTDDKAQSTVERLRSMAERLEESAQELLDADRKTNTEKRAREAARAESIARDDLQLARTMRNIANAIDAGEAVFLEGVRTKAQIEMLRTMLDSAKREEIRADSAAKNGGEASYSDELKRAGEAPTRRTARFIRYPRYTIYRGDLAQLGRELLEMQGAKQIGQSILKSADDVTDKYEAFVKENLHLVALRTTSGGTAVFPTKALAEDVRKRSPGHQKMVTVNVGKAKNYVVLSPREAQSRGLWPGDEKKQFSIGEDLALEIIEKVNAHNAKVGWNGKIHLPWTFEDAKEKRARLKAMGITNASMLREAAREFVGLTDAKQKADPIKEKMRALVGQKGIGIDFFPTPAGEAAGVVVKADIRDGMDVLDAGAGYGAIADEVRKAGVEPDVVELSSTLREILDLKGYQVVGHDFLEYSGKQYDRIVMNPPFSKDIEFVRHAYSLLKPKGRIVSIMGAGAFYRGDKKATEFRDWADSLGAIDEELPEGTFLDPSLPATTGANARVIVIDKPDAPMQKQKLQAPAPAPVLKSREVRDEVNRILREFKTRPRLLVVDTHEQLPQNVKDGILERGGVLGMQRAIQWHGGIYIIANQYTDIAEVLDTVLHETVVHFGLRSVLDPETHNQIRDGIARDQEEVVRGMGRLEFGDRYDHNNPVMRRIAAEEVLAYYAPDYIKGRKLPGKLEQWVKALVDAIKAFIAKLVGSKPETLVLPDDYNREAMNRIIDALELYLKRGRGPDYVETADQAAMAETRTVQMEDGSRRPITDANGKLVAETVEQQRNFWRWFGDSKVVDAHGRPIVHYHSTFTSFDAFDPARADIGFHFGQAEVANNRIDKAASERKLRGHARSSGANVMPVYLSIKNPLHLKDQAQWRAANLAYLLEKELNVLPAGTHERVLRMWREQVRAQIPNGISIADEASEAAFKKIDEQISRELLASEIVPALEALGYDGISYVNVYEGVGKGKRERRANADKNLSYIAFHPNQIKSAIGNRGTFDPRNNDILFERSQPAPMFFSALTRAAEQSKTAKAPAQQWIATLRNTPGVKEEELAWSGVEDWLKSLGRPATRDELVDFLRANEVQIKEVVKGGDAASGTSKVDRLVVELDALGYDVDIQDDHFNSMDVTRRSDGNTLVYRSTEGEYVVYDDYGNELGKFDQIPEEHQRKLQELRDALVEHDFDVDEDGTKYTSFTLPGGEKYRELLLTMPPKEDVHGMAKRKAVYDKYQPLINKADDTEGSAAFNESQRLRRERDAEADAVYRLRKGNEFKHAHWGESNVLAHVRFDERTDADGKRVLFVQEIQSDWHQAGRKKGYKRQNDPSQINFNTWADARGISRDERERLWLEQERLQGADRELWREWRADADRIATGVPDAPLKTTWPEFAFKRVLRWAAENGFERVAWTTGQQQNERYNLTKFVSSIHLDDNSSGGVSPPNMDGPFEYGYLTAFGERGREVLHQRVSSPDEIEEIIGHELTQKILNVEPVAARVAGLGMRRRALIGLDLEVGGEGMRGFYDKMLPAMVNRLTKKWGGKVATTTVAIGDGRSWDLENLGSHARVVHYDARGERIEGLPFNTVAEAQAYIEQMEGRQRAVTHSVDVTPQMRDAALAGQPMFQQNPSSVGAAIARQLKPGTPQRKGYAALADRIINAWNRKIGGKYGALGNLPESKQYLIHRYRTLGGLSQVREVTKGIYDTFSAATADDSKAVYEYLTTAGAQPDGIVDEKVRAKAIAVKEMIDAQGQALVQAGLLPEESYEKYKDQYLPRLYLRHVLDDGNTGKMSGAGKRLSDQGYLKKRKDIPEEVRKVILGEITDPAFLGSFAIGKVQRDLHIMSFLQTVSQNAAWTPPQMLVDWDGRKVSVFWLQAEAKQLRLQADHMRPRPDLAAKARAIADKMDTLANAALAELHRDVDLSDFEQIPDSARYGALRGLYVRKEIHEDLVGAYNFVDSSNMTGFAGALERTFGQGGALTKATQAWKTSKVALNVPSHIRNMVGNLMLLHLSGVPAYRMPDRLVSAINSVITKDRWYQIARKYGLEEATFANRELMRVRDEWVRLQKSKGAPWNRALAMFGQVTDAVGGVYQFEEALFKIMKLQDAMDREGMSEADAMIEAHKWVFDYSLVPRWVRYLRNAPFGIPFLSYTYFAAPRLMETAVRRPWKFLPYIALMYALQEAFVSAWGGDDDDVEQLKKSFPSWMNEKGSLMLLPYKDANGNWQVLDWGYMVPWGQFQDTVIQASHGNLRQSAETLGVLSGPIPDLVSVWQTGIDPFTQKPIASPGDPPAQQVKSYLTYMWGMAAPGFITGQGALGKLSDAYGGKVNARTGEPSVTKGQAWARLVGFNVYPVDPEATRETNLFFMQKEIDEARMRLRQKLRDRNLDDEARQEIRRVHQKHIDELVKKRQEYDRDSRVPTHLRKDRDLTSQVESLLDGKTKQETVQALRDAGYPAFASLIEEMPAKPRKIVQESLASMRA